MALHWRSGGTDPASPTGSDGRGRPAGLACRSAAPCCRRRRDPTSSPSAPADPSGTPPRRPRPRSQQPADSRGHPSAPVPSASPEALTVEALTYADHAVVAPRRRWRVTTPHDAVHARPRAGCRRSRGFSGPPPPPGRGRPYLASDDCVQGPGEGLPRAPCSGCRASLERSAVPPACDGARSRPRRTYGWQAGSASSAAGRLSSASPAEAPGPRTPQKPRGRPSRSGRP